MRLPRLFFALSLLTLCGPAFCASVDTLDIPSAGMNRSMRAAIVLPASYANAKTKYPVLYLLHGGGGTFSDWLKQTPDRMLVHKLADQHNLIIVMPEGERLGGYLDSPLQKDNQFETYITKEVIDKIDNTYRTIRDRKGRLITGLSMGGARGLIPGHAPPGIILCCGQHEWSPGFEFGYLAHYARVCQTD